MGIWDLSKEELEEFVQKVHGESGERLLSPAPWWAGWPDLLEFFKIFAEVVLLFILLMINFYLWLDAAQIIGETF